MAWLESPAARFLVLDRWASCALDEALLWPGLLGAPLRSAAFFFLASRPRCIRLVANSHLFCQYFKQDCWLFFIFYCSWSWWNCLWFRDQTWQLVPSRRASPCPSRGVASHPPASLAWKCCASSGRSFRGIVISPFRRRLRRAHSPFALGGSRLTRPTYKSSRPFSLEWAFARWRHSRTGSQWLVSVLTQWVLMPAHDSGCSFASASRPWPPAPNAGAFRSSAWRAALLRAW